VELARFHDPAYIDAVQRAEAEQDLLRIVPVLTQALGADHPETAEAQGALAKIYRLTDRMQEAEPLLREAIASLEGQAGYHGSLLTTQSELGVVLCPTEPGFRRADAGSRSETARVRGLRRQREAEVRGWYARGAGAMLVVFSYAPPRRRSAAPPAL